MKSIPKYLVATTLWLLCQIGWAQNFDEKIEAQSRSPAERSVYLANGLNQLVNRLSGNQEAFQKPEILKAQTSVLDYVLSYQYITEPDPLNLGANKLYLSIHFDPKAVEKLMHQAKLSLPPAKSESLVQQETSVEPNGYTGNSLHLVVNNIEEVDDYNDVMSYLSGLDAISSIQVVELAPPEISFEVTVNGGQDALKQVLLLGNVLTPEINSTFPKQETQDNTLKYRYER